MSIERISVEPRDADDGEPESALKQRLEALEQTRSRRRSPLRWVLPLLAVGVGIAIFGLLVATREKPVTRDLPVPSPLVRVMTAAPETVRLSVIARGTVTPRTESDIVAEVRGRVVWVSQKLVVGGVFEEGDELLRLDERDYRIGRDRARASVALRESEARLALSEAGRRRQLEQRGASSASDLDQFENRELVANALLAEARAVLEQAELDYERTRVRAPYRGRVRERSVDVGLFVSPGTKLGRIFAVDYAEVRLPVQTDDLAFLDVDLDGAGMAAVEGARVALTGRLGGREFIWPARLDRAEAAIDERTRMLHVVARVDDPYALGVEDTLGPTPESGAAERSSFGVVDREPVARSRVPLPSGLFVTAEIEGRTVSDVFVLPLMALRDGNRVFVATPVAASLAGGGPATDRIPLSDQPVPTDGSRKPMGRESRLSVREVSIVRRDHDRVVIDAGLEAGDQIVISPLRIYSEGMLLRLVETDES